MSIPDPKPGLVVRYDYLWSREAAAGRDHGKERPTCIVAATGDLASPRYVVLLPITHSPPSGASVGIEIPLNVKRKIGLDDEPSWIIISEYNVKEWPNGGLSTIPGRNGVFAYGFIPPGLFAAVKTQFLDLAKANKSKPAQR
jgi:hypothetical protein